MFLFCLGLLYLMLPIHQAGTSLLKSGLLKLVINFQTCYNFLKQIAASLWITSFDNEVAASLLTAHKKLLQAMQTHLDVRLHVASFCKMTTDLLQMCNVKGI